MASRTVREPAVPYVLEQLFIDQERDFVVDTIAHVLAWVPGQAAGKQAQPFLFDVDHIVGPKRVGVQIELMWSQPILERAVPGLRAQVSRLHTAPWRETSGRAKGGRAALLAVRNGTPPQKPVQKC